MTAMYVGIMSGTSMDGIDLVAVSFDPLTLHATLTVSFPEELRNELMALSQPGDNEIERMGQADVAYARLVGQAVVQLIKNNGLDASKISAIGSHGQTIRHRPHLGFSLQIGDPNLIAEISGIPVVSDFRRRDLAAGGQGAPLVPAFHQALFAHSTINRIILNLGGIANISILPAGNPAQVYGYDTGPANVLMDGWCKRHTGQHYDEDGAWAAHGNSIPALMELMQRHDYFAKRPPKSTGREDFNLEWLDNQLDDWRNQVDYDPNDDLPENVQATLLKLTVRPIKKAVARCGLAGGELYVCGGGAYNITLMEQLRWRLAKHDWTVESTVKLGLAPTWVEATAFAWLARQRMQQQPGNLPAVTGASGLRILGTVTG
ncbi:anhydro-N-acetylmuramic acid kinase [Alkanindiges sp. WGS2144]|uniref:anhydro-N-acetylmuramic acid kinase n=1 Tax=Alkanindiges sp. WGS2144 TaxID=3366808 RepID=UPI0037502DE0